MKNKIKLEQFLDERGQLHNFLCEACLEAKAHGGTPSSILEYAKLAGIDSAFVWWDTVSGCSFWNALNRDWLCEKH